MREIVSDSRKQYCQRAAVIRISVKQVEYVFTVKLHSIFPQAQGKCPWIFCYHQKKLKVVLLAMLLRSVLHSKD
jgi:hypothetical protein